MKCLIIAAGSGERLRYRGSSKPLVPILGIPLIERVFRSVTQSGIDDFCVVTGYNGKKVRSFLDGLASRLGVSITHVVNDEWNEGNGLSVLKARECMGKERFLLLMSDHLFDGSVLHDLEKHPPTDGEVTLAVDLNTSNPLVDMEDVTRVMCEAQLVREIGKGLVEFNGFDTGIFHCTPALFDALEWSAREDNDTSLSGGIRHLAANGNVKVCDVSGRFWLDVDDKRAFERAEKQLYGKLIKPIDGLISRYINRRFSIGIFTPLFLKLYKGITPNQVSILSFIVGLISSLCFFLGHAITGALLIQISSILDGCDGEIARLKYMQSSLGDFVDAVLDRYADSFILAGILYYLLVEIGNKDILGIYWDPLIIGSISVSAIVGNLMVSYTSAKSIVNFNYRYKGRWIAGGRGRDLRLFLLFVGGIMTYFHPIFLLFAVLVTTIQTNIIVLWRVLLSWSYFLKESSLIKGKIKAVIFDFDGTVANTMPFLTEIAVKLMTEKYHILKEEAERKYFETTGMDFVSQMELIFPSHPNNQEVANAFEAMKAKGILAHPIFPEVIPTLRYFNKKKIKTFICSSTKQEIISAYIKLNKLDDLLDGFFGFKPSFRKDEQINFVLKHYKLRAEEVLFIGDSLRDLDFVKDKTMRFIGVSRIFEKTEFEKRGILSVSCLTDLVKLFGESEKYSNSFEGVS